MDRAERKTTKRLPCLSVLGGCTLYGFEGSRISIPNKKVRAVLAYLALEQKSAVTRERLAGLLWSETDEFRARQSLRQALVKLRLVFDEANVTDYHIDRDELFVSQGAISVDIHSLDSDIANRQFREIEAAEPIQPDRILYGLESLDGLFDSWIHHVRHSWRERIVGRLQTLLEDIDQELSRSAAKALISIDPTHEPAQRVLIRFHADHGNSPAAERQYRMLWDELDTFGSEPDDATQALIVQIKSGEYFSKALAETSNLPPEVRSSPVLSSQNGQSLLPYIYVHDFQSAAPAGGSSLLGSSLRLEFISNLVRFRDWTILDGKHGSMNPDYRSSNAGDVAGNHSYAVYGTIYQAGEENVLVITLKDLNSGTYLWSDRINTHVDNWVHAQRRISVQIAASLNTHLTAKLAANQISRQAIENDDYLRWLDYYQKFWSWDPRVRGDLRTSLTDIIERNPRFAPAYTGLVTILNTQQVIYPGVFTDADLLKEASKLSQRAVKLDPLDARNIGNFAWSCAMLGRFDEAKANFIRAIELNPNNPNSVIGCSNGLTMCGDQKEGYKLTKDAMISLPTLTPVQWAYITSTFCLNQRFEESIRAAEFAQGSLPTVQGFLTVAQALSGKTKDAVATAELFIQNAQLSWQGTQKPNRHNICQWFINHCPVRSPDMREILKSGLREAGLT